MALSKSLSRDTVPLRLNPSLLLEVITKKLYEIFGEISKKYRLISLNFATVS
jgi:hypothetical protein